jgi:hypothetical protein
MLFLTLFVLTVITICVFHVWPMLDGSPADPLRSRLSSAADQAAGTAAARPESLEGVLVAQLMAGEITRGQYLRTVEGIAARDDERHPLAVPPDLGPADA